MSVRSSTQQGHNPQQRRSQGTAKRSLQRRIFGTLLRLAMLNTTVAVSAQPTAIEPLETMRLNRLTHYSSNWSETDQFDLDNPVEIVVTLRGIDLPENAGAAYLLFTLDLPQGTHGAGRQAGSTLFRATLQTAGELRRLKLGRESFTAGRQAILRGWPSSATNNSATIMLVDEVEILHNGQLRALHLPHPKMRKKTKDKNKS